LATNGTTRIRNPKAAAWDRLGASYWDHGYDGGPTHEGCGLYLDGVEAGQAVAVIGASTVRLVRASLRRDAVLTVADFSAVMLHDLAVLIGDGARYLHADVTVPDALPSTAFDAVLADRLINRFTLAELEKALTTLVASLRPQGQLRLSYRVGLYERDLPVIEEARRRGELAAVFDEEVFDVDYSGAADWLGTVLSPHGQIPMADLVEFYVRRGREHRLHEGELDNLLDRIAASNNWRFTVTHLDLPSTGRDRMLVVARHS